MRGGWFLVAAGCASSAPLVGSEGHEASAERVLPISTACHDLSMSAGSSRDKVYVYIRAPGTMEQACSAGTATRTFSLPSPDLMVERYLGRHLISACSEWDPRERVTGYALPIAGTATIEVTPVPGATFDRPLSTVHVTLNQVVWQTRSGATLPVIDPVEWTGEWHEIGYDTGAVTGAGPCAVP